MRRRCESEIKLISSSFVVPSLVGGAGPCLFVVAVVVVVAVVIVVVAVVAVVVVAVLLVVAVVVAVGS